MIRMPFLVMFIAFLVVGAKLRLTGVPTNRAADRYVGVPINPAFGQAMSGQARQQLRQKYGLPAKGLLVVATGGSLGALNLNRGVLAVIDRLRYKRAAHFVIVSGKANHLEAKELLEEVERRARVTILDFVDDMPNLLRTADLVITRAGATALAEVAAAGKPAIVIPNPLLPGAHQVHNAQTYAQTKAALIVSDSGQQVNLRPCWPAWINCWPEPNCVRNWGRPSGNWRWLMPLTEPFRPWLR